MGINAEYMGVKMLLSARLTETRTSQAARGVLMLFTLACCLPCEALPKGPQEPKMVKCLRGLMSTCHDQVLGVMLGKEREARLISCTRGHQWSFHPEEWGCDDLIRRKAPSVLHLCGRWASRGCPTAWHQVIDHIDSGAQIDMPDDELLLRLAGLVQCLGSLSSAAQECAAVVEGTRQWGNLPNITASSSSSSAASSKSATSNSKASNSSTPGSKIHPNKSKLNSFDKTSKDGGNVEWWLLAITLAAVLGTTILYFVRQRQKKVNPGDHDQQSRKFLVPEDEEDYDECRPNEADFVEYHDPRD